DEKVARIARCVLSCLVQNLELHKCGGISRDELIASLRSVVQLGFEFALPYPHSPWIGLHDVERGLGQQTKGAHKILAQQTGELVGLVRWAREEGLCQLRPLP